MDDQHVGQAPQVQLLVGLGVERGQQRQVREHEAACTAMFRPYTSARNAFISSWGWQRRNTKG